MAGQVALHLDSPGDQNLVFHAHTHEAFVKGPMAEAAESSSIYLITATWKKPIIHNVRSVRREKMLIMKSLLPVNKLQRVWRKTLSATVRD